MLPGAETVDTFAQADASPPPSALSAIATLPPTGTWAVAARCAVLAEGAMALVMGARCPVNACPKKLVLATGSAPRVASLSLAPRTHASDATRRILQAAAAALLDGSPGQVKATFKSALRCAALHARVRCRL